MSVEIERKYLVKNEKWRDSVESEARIMQGYLANNANATVRVRIKGDSAYLTIKGMTRGVSRAEYEYPIPVSDAEAMLNEMPVSPVIDKIRHLVRCGQHLWELRCLSRRQRGAGARRVGARVRGRGLRAARVGRGRGLQRPALLQREPRA